MSRAVAHTSTFHPHHCVAQRPARVQRPESRTCGYLAVLAVLIEYPTSSKVELLRLSLDNVKAKSREKCHDDTLGDRR